METIIICNPGAGGVSDASSLAKQFARIPGATVLLTTSSGGATELARGAAQNGAELIIAAGGDGTLNEVINGVAEFTGRVRLGLIPLGTGNDFARALDLPANADAAIDIILTGTTQPLDLVRVTSDQVRYFLNVSAAGFSCTVSEKMTPEMKQNWGPLAYLRGAASALADLKAYRTELVLDDQERRTLSTYNVVIANGRYVAGGIPVAPQALLDDGLLDIVVIPELSAADLAVLAAQVLVGKHLDNEKLFFCRASKVSIHSEPGMWFNVDGETVGNEPAVFEIIPRAVNFIVPSESESSR